MAIVGVNGWFFRSHDAAACVVDEGEVVSFVEEERLTRYKHAFEQIPHRSILEALRIAGIRCDDIDTLAIGWDYHQKYYDRRLSIPALGRDLSELYLPRRLFAGKKELKVAIIEHHLAHASNVYRLSPTENSVVLVVDGQGENECLSVWHGTKNELKCIARVPVQYSIGYLFETANRIIGLKDLDSGKLMGLSAYGTTDYLSKHFRLDNFSIDFPDVDTLKKTTSNLDEQIECQFSWRKAISTYLPSSRTLPDDQNLLHENEFATNLAYSVQKSLERVLLHIAQHARSITKADDICLSGGVALNCKANTHIYCEGGYKNVFVVPSGHDAGVSVGAALEADSRTSKNKTTPVFASPYLGAEYSDDKIEEALWEHGMAYDHSQIPQRIAAELISRGNILGWVQGRAEMGPRALGNRSILADPRDPHTLGRVNDIKGRESWRPLAAAILSEKAETVLEFVPSSPFMLFAARLTPLGREKFSAAAHVDGSCRAQIVYREQNAKFWHLIREFYDITGVPGVINTSFNHAQEPIVYSLRDCILSFLRMKLDYLVMGNFIAKCLR